ncbi:MAG: class I SAM-dependent methyltransferase [Pseudoxanthomonas sp.]
MQPVSENPRPRSFSALFGVVAPEVGWAPPIRFLLRRARVLRLLYGRTQGNIIEVGCGAGALLHELALPSKDAIGLETSPRALAIARKIAVLAEGKQRISNQPDATLAGTRDLVCAFDVLEHIEDDHAALKEWVGWLAPDGMVCVSVPAHRNRWGAGDEWAGHWRRYDRGDLVHLLESSGLVVEQFECYGFPLANFTEWWGNRTYRRLLQQRGKSVSMEQATSESGVERSDYLRLFRRMDTPLGRTALRAALWMQSLTRNTDWGSGYLVLARRA